MKVKPANADRFAAKPDANIRAVLVYGPDRGLVRERAGKLIRSVVTDPEDPFRVAELTGDQVKKTPAALADEAAAMAFGGGQRVVIVRAPTEDTANTFRDFLADPAGDALVVVEAGDLDGRSKLRAAFEKADRGAALPCYRDEGRDLSGLIQETLKGYGLSVSREALGYLSQHLGADRGITRSELEKLALYKGSGEVQLEDATSCVGDSAALSLDDVANAVADGDLAGLERAFDRALAEGANAIQPLRATANHFKRLHQVAGARDVEQAVDKLRPPVFWKAKPRFTAQAKAWSPALVGQVLDGLLDAEARCKSTGMPVEAVAARELMRIASRSPLRQRRKQTAGGR
ncbi:DNA polymerase III subunit delta [Rhodovibrio salinarum]|uniref:DNA polymerase III subunit delta n=1 Tax=Rhodovibrio salinarum TaxID=1087 RepID=A0A934QH23_9PROT|nr:DNA polymerase III subunit delta [Rhodovibrio salinarum]MBK1696893.1 DNA polymerase III subunit delta [Rhodovibrio salinarum]